MKPSRAELFEVVYRYYPREMLPISRMHVGPHEIVYDDTEEHCRLMTACARGRREWPRWKALIRRLGIRYRVQDESLHLVAGNIDAGYSGRVWVAGTAKISVHVSLLGPYYALQLPGVPGEEAVVQDILYEIETTFPGYRTIAPEIGNEIVPDVCNTTVDFGVETIYTLLFSGNWTNDGSHYDAKE